MLVTIPVIIQIKKIIYNRKSILICFVSTFLILLIYGEIIRMLMPDDLLYWMFIFPPSRIFEYIMAILLGMYTREISNDYLKKNTSIWWYTMLETLSLITLIVVIMFLDSNQYLSMNIAWIIPTSLILWVFSFDKGYLSKILGSNVFVFLGNLTFESYLFHEIVDRYFYVIPEINDNLVYGAKVLYFSYILIMTFVISYILHKKTRTN